MGITDTGGYLQDHYVYEHDLKGLYDATELMLKIVVHGRDMSQLEMRDACAARRDQVLGPERPLRRIAYIFLEAARAEAHLHELWLRELECWTIRDGLEVRLDTAYQPVPIKPAWA
jgi:hypothetical protein